MSVEVSIYMNNVIKFFNENPKELLSLVTEDKKEVFYEKIKEKALENFKKGEEITLTQKQFIEICVELSKKESEEVSYNKNIFIEEIYLKLYEINKS